MRHQEMGMLAGKVALVTGGASGIGRASVGALAAAGASIVVADLNHDAALSVAAKLEETGTPADAVLLDVRSAISVSQCFETALGRFGRLDIAVNSAGVAGPADELKDIDESAFDHVIAINLKGIWLCMRKELEIFHRQGSGVIVNVASILALVGLGRSAAYVAAKHGVLGLTRAASIEVAERGIRVNAVCPGVIETPMTDAFGAEPLKALTPLHPMNRLGQPREVADVIVWLASPGASFVTGAAIPVDGGWTAQ